MKYLLVLIVVAIAIGIWRSKRRIADSSRPSTRPATALSKPQAMVECAHCGLHLPKADAVSDAQGQLFCSAEHRRLAARSPSDR